MKVTIIEGQGGFCKFEARVSVHEQDTLGEAAEDALKEAVARMGYRILSWETSIVHKAEDTFWLVTGHGELITQ